MFILRVSFTEADQSNVTPRHVRLAYVFRSPYRFYIGPAMRLEMSHAGYQFEIFARNRVVVAEDEPLPNFPWHDYPPHPDLTTDFVIVERSPEVCRDHLPTIADLDHEDELRWLYFPSDHWRIINVYRHVILALDTMVHQLDWRPGPQQVVRAPSFEQVRSLVSAAVFVLCPPDVSLENVHFEHILTVVDQQQPSTVTLLLQEEEIRRRFGATPLQQKQIQEIERFLALQERYLHYEFEHQAEIAWNIGDYPTALLAAVVALESAHSAFVRLAMEERLPREMRDKERNQVVDRLLREHGIHSLIQVTPYLFLPPERQPSLDLVKQCAEGLEMRNAIVHAKSKGDQPVLRRFDSSKYRRAVRGVLGVYELFATELERRHNVTVSRRLPLFRLE